MPKRAKSRINYEALDGNLRQLIKDKGMTITGFAEAVAGKSESGKVRFNGLYSVLNGSRPFDNAVAEAWGAALGVSPDEIKALGVGDDLHANAEPNVKAPRAAHVSSSSEQTNCNGQQFAIVIDSDGSASLRLQVSGLRFETAQRAMSALLELGILPTD